VIEPSVAKAEVELSRVMAVTLNLLAERSDFRIRDPKFPDAFAMLVPCLVGGSKVCYTPTMAMFLIWCGVAIAESGKWNWVKRKTLE
jgi:hypothetical protein